jgi:hypothetical protein
MITERTSHEDECSARGIRPEPIIVIPVDTNGDGHKIEIISIRISIDTCCLSVRNVLHAWDWVISAYLLTYYSLHCAL